MKNDNRITKTLGVCRKLVSTSFSHGWSKKQDLNEAQRELKLPQHSLVTDCQTRLSSMQKRVSRILEAIHKVLHNDHKYCHLVPMWQDVDVLESLDAALGTISNFTCFQLKTV